MWVVIVRHRDFDKDEALGGEEVHGPFNEEKMADKYAYNFVIKKPQYRSLITKIDPPMKEIL